MSQNRAERIQALVDDQRGSWSSHTDIRSVEAYTLRAVLEMFAPDVLAEFDRAWKRPGSFWTDREAAHREHSACTAQRALDRILSAELYSRSTPAERQAEYEREMAELGIIGYEQKYERF